MTVEYTQEELAEFRRLVDGTESRDQVTRISARMSLREFVARAGKEKCDAMFAAIEQEPEA